MFFDLQSKYEYSLCPAFSPNRMTHYTILPLVLHLPKLDSAEKKARLKTENINTCIHEFIQTPCQEPKSNKTRALKRASKPMMVSKKCFKTC